MSISAFMGANSVIRPGVVTSSTRPSSPFIGQLIFETDTNRLAAYNGSAWITQNGLQMIANQTIGSAVASVTVTGAFSAAYNSYKIIVDGGVGSATALLGLKLGAAATGYYEASIRANYSTGTVDSGSGSNTTSFSRAGNVNASYINFAVDLINPFAAKYTLINGMWISLTQGGHYSGYLADTNSYTDFTLTPASGTLTGGIISVYGYSDY